ncbi:integral membrane protein [Nannizzia gypsea CBS 118893]|uniref:Integral membrane protein n=1 Tax=Arthroderma gypseum (strain ATCC MYA-4604 / CBS 118893) TaxID=535722 RepID=E4UQ79_ARTGP|nr:integral membrane protein [Nannizzia gypsea CBS 118893]EFQ99998.1 integral membrane protein [Nannizzia gypsea CBS 118893]
MAPSNSTTTAPSAVILGMDRADLWVPCVVLVIVSGLLVVVRLVGRYYRAGIHVDDYMILSAYIITAPFTAVMILGVFHGVGKHTWESSPQDRITALKCLYILQVLYKPALGLIKIAFLFLYLRIFYVQKWFRWSCYFLMGLTVLMTIGFTCPSVWQCKPISAYWDRSIPHKCIENAQWRIVYSGLNVATDFLIFLLPIKQAIALPMRMRDKLAVICIFSLGGFVCVVSIVRITYILGKSDNKDPLWSIAPLALWTTIELNTGIIVSCLPMLRQPLSLLCPSLLSSLRDGSRSYRENSHQLKDGNSGGESGRGAVPAGSADSRWVDHYNDDIYMDTVTSRIDIGGAGSKECIFSPTPPSDDIAEDLDTLVPTMPPIYSSRVGSHGSRDQP